MKTLKLIGRVNRRLTCMCHHAMQSTLARLEGMQNSIFDILEDVFGTTEHDPVNVERSWR